MPKLNRRDFIRTTLVAGAGASLWPTLARGQDATANVVGANGDVRLAIVGLNGRGKNHITAYSGLKGVRIVALCDPDTAVIAETKEKLKDKLTGPFETYVDYRKLLESKEIDAVSIAMPNHWHSLAGIWAVQAGKPAFVEKPVSHNVWEGRKLVEASRKYNKIIQTGSQTRSSFAVKEAIAWVRAGNLGTIRRARVLCYNRRDSIGKADGPLAIPSTVDYNLWSGPAPMETLHRKRLHYDWHWHFTTGNGDIGNQGVHQVDMARWAMGYEELPEGVFSLGGRLGYDDDANTPNTQIVFYDYKPAPIIFEVRGLPTTKDSKDMDKYHGHRGVSAVIECDGGYLVIPNYVSAIACDKDDKEIKKWEGADNHYENFLKAVRSGKREDLNADVLVGHLSAALCHVGNISYQLGSRQTPEKIQEEVKNNKDVAEAYGRMEQHLTANQVDLHKTPATLGVALKIDPKKEQFKGNKAANALLTRNYREPFVVPEKV